MNPIIKNILALLAGILIGSLVNMGLIMISGNIIPPPLGADLTSIESLKETMHLFEPKHFIFPFLAHALGTLVGAYIAARIAANRKMAFAMVIGLFFLVGGITNLFLLPSPVWFSMLDAVVAYLPMAYVGGKMASIKKTTAV